MVFPPGCQAAALGLCVFQDIALVLINIAMCMCECLPICLLARMTACLHVFDCLLACVCLSACLSACLCLLVCLCLLACLLTYSPGAWDNSVDLAQVEQNIHTEYFGNSAGAAREKRTNILGTPWASVRVGGRPIGRPVEKPVELGWLDASSVG